MVVICLGNDVYGGEFAGKGNTPENALQDIQNVADDIDMSSVVFYTAEKMNFRVDTTPRIVSLGE